MEKWARGAHFLRKKPDLTQVHEKERQLHREVSETVRDRAAEVLDRAPGVLACQGFDPGPLQPFRRRLETGRLPADDLIDLYEREPSIPAVLRHLATLIPAGVVGTKPIVLVTG